MIRICAEKFLVLINSPQQNSNNKILVYTIKIAARKYT